jgi:hypothetical protein
MQLPIQHAPKKGDIVTPRVRVSAQKVHTMKNHHAHQQANIAKKYRAK